jgi:hypothetical protein
VLRTAAVTKRVGRDRPGVVGERIIGTRVLRRASGPQCRDLEVVGLEPGAVERSEESQGTRQTIRGAGADNIDHAAPASFLPVRVLPPNTAPTPESAEPEDDSLLEVILHSGRRVRLRGRFSVSIFRDIVRVLEDVE